MVFIKNYPECHFSWLSSTAILTHVLHGFHQRLSWLMSCMVFISSYPNSCLVWFSSTAILTHVSHGFHQRLSWLMSCMVFHQWLSWLMSRMVLITSYPDSCLAWFSSTAILTDVFHGFSQQLSW